MKTKLTVFATLAGLIAGAAIYLTPQVKAFEDSTPSEVSNLTVTPTEFDTSESSKSITITLTVTDSGVGTCPTQGSNGCESYDLNKSALQVDIKPLIGTQGILAFASDWTRISGDDYSGVYRATKTVPYGSKVGIWAVYDVYVSDKIGNTKWWNTSSTAGIPDVSTIPNSSGLTIANTAESSSVTIDREWIISSTSASVTFPVGTVVTKLTGGSFGFYKMVGQDTTIGDLTTDGLTGSPVGTVKIGIPELNLSFSKPVTVSLNVGSPYNGATLTIKTLTEGATSWANETTCTVSNGICQFTVSHASYFSAVATGKNAPGKLTLKVSVKKRVKKASVRLSGKTGRYISITISVNGVEKVTLRASKKGKFAYRAPLTVGKNTISIVASNGIRTKTINRTVTYVHK